MKIRKYAPLFGCEPIPVKVVHKTSHGTTIIQPLVMREGKLQQDFAHDRFPVASVYLHKR